MFGFSSQLTEDTMLSLKEADPSNDPDQNLTAKEYSAPARFKIDGQAYERRRIAAETLNPAEFKLRLHRLAISMPVAAGAAAQVDAGQQGDAEPDVEWLVADAGNDAAVLDEGYAVAQDQATGAAPLEPQGGGIEGEADGATGTHEAGAGQGLGAGPSTAEDGTGPAGGDDSGAAAAHGAGSVSVAHAGRVAPTVPRWSGGMPLGLGQHAAFDSASSITAAAAAASAGQVAPPSAGNNVGQGSSPPHVASGVTTWQQLMLPTRRNGTAHAGFGTGVGAGRSAEQGAGPADVAAAPGEERVGGTRTGILIPIGAGRDGVWPELALPSGPGRAAAIAQEAKSTESKPGMMTAAKLLARRKKG